MTEQQHPFNILAEMAQMSHQTAAGLPAQDEVQEYWSGIAFTLGGMRFIAPMGEVAEILQVPHYSGLPGVKPWVLGVANVRGRLVPIIELATFLGLDRRAIARNQRILVIEVNDMLNGLVVDSVEGLQNIRVEEYSEQNQADLPEQLSEFVAGYYHQGRTNLNVFGVHNLVVSENFMSVAS